MNTLRQIYSASLLVLALLATAVAQDSPSASAQRSSLTITAAAAGERVRITAPSSIVQMHVEVYAASGEKLFDQEIRGGNVFDWHLQDGQAERLVAGEYVCVVTVKNISSRSTQKIGTVRIGEKDVSVEAAALLSPQQSQAIGPVEDNSSWMVLDGKENQTTTVIAHDGRDGQITRGQGALSFRLGDFFSGNDREQMRLTEEGNLGIGTSKPQFKLDVAGTIRARQGFVFNDGSTLNVNDKGALTLTDSNGNATPNVGGTGTQGRLAKWTDNSGTLGDSVVLDTGTGLQLTAAPDRAADTNLFYLNSTNGTTGVLAGSVPSFGATNGPFFAMRGNTYTTIANQRGLFTIAAGNVSSPVGDDGSVKFNTGNDQLRMVIRPNGRVGIGTATPETKLDVAGSINAFVYESGGIPLLTFAGNANLYVGPLAGESVSGGSNSNTFVGYAAGQNMTSGSLNTFIGMSAGVPNTDGIAKTFVGYNTALATTTGNNNTFFGYAAGSNNHTGNSITLLGAGVDGGANNLNVASAIGAGV